jgi:two-component system, sensor histidine kinase
MAATTVGPGASLAGWPEALPKAWPAGTATRPLALAPAELIAPSAHLAPLEHSAPSAHLAHLVAAPPGVRTADTTEPAAPASTATSAFVAVEGRLLGSAQARAASEGASVHHQLLGASQRTAIAALPALALGLGLVWLVAMSLLLGQGPSASQLVAALWTPVMAIAMAALGTHAARLAGMGTAPWLVLLLGAAVGPAGLVALTEPHHRPLLTALIWVWVLSAAVMLAPWRRAAATVLWLPAVAGVLTALGVSPSINSGANLSGNLSANLNASATTAWTPDISVAASWLVAAVATTAAALGLVLWRHRHWHREQRTRLILEARTRLLQDERDAAVRADQDKSRFVAIASHDLRQPVHALGLFAATLQKRLINTPDEALARNFLRAVDDLEHSFSSMLDISRLEAGCAAPLTHTFPLRDLFRRLHMQYAGHAEVSGLGLRFSPGGKSVTSDPQLLERIVGNLIQNAIKYTTQGGVVVVARSTRTHINVEVWDTGSGIAPTEVPKVFQEFYQVGRVGSLGGCRRDRSHGLGMGLAIVKRLTELLGHRLEVASRPGCGTMFRVGIPLGALPGIQDSLAPADTVPMQVQSAQMVLIVEDEEPIREGLRVLLREWGYQTITAANAAEAEQAVLALEGRVDLVLSDLQLGQDTTNPGRDASLDGASVVDNVRRLCGYAVPAVIVTGDTSAQAARMLAARGDPVLFKPVQPRRLFDAMQAALG